MSESDRMDEVGELPRSDVPGLLRVRALWERVAGYFLTERVSFLVAALPALVVSAVLYTRSLASNFIFDEQEALLANPYINGKNLHFIDAVHRDFWGLPPERSVGSYRPLPNMLWRLLSQGLCAVHDSIKWIFRLSSEYALHPWVFHWCNVLLHAANGALLVVFVQRVSRRRDLAWLSGAFFVTCAVLTEAVSGVVGTADVLGGLGAVLALLSLALPLYAMPLGVFGAVLLGLFSKESALVCVPLVPWAALVLAPYLHAKHPRRVLRALAALVAATAAFVLYVECRKRWFPSALPSELTTPLPEDAGALPRVVRTFHVWFHQPALPRDPLNNPLVQADTPHRVAGALRVFARAVGQLFLPTTLSGDYSFPAEPMPEKLFFFESVVGGGLMAGAPLAAIALWIRSVLSVRKEARRLARIEENVRCGVFPVVEPGETALAAEGVRAGSAAAIMVDGPLVPCAGAALSSVGLLWIVVSYFPHSNIPVLLPTVRAERFLYLPAMGFAMAMAAFVSALYKRFATVRAGRLVVAATAGWLAFQMVRARWHACDYTDDLAFWGATKDAVPNSAKAHLNYSVMWGARGRLDIRLAENEIAVGLAPKWPMARIYLGDTLCRLHRPHEAWPHYREGFRIADADPNLIALSLQCLWDEKAVSTYEAELVAMADERRGSWLDYLARDIVHNGSKHGGVDPKYRPRGYNEGPKE